MKVIQWLRDHRYLTLNGINGLAGVVFFAGIISLKQELIPMNIGAFTVCMICKLLLWWMNCDEEKKASQNADTS